MKLLMSFLLILFISHTYLSAEPLIEPIEEQADASTVLNSYLKSLESYEANFQQQTISSARRLMDSVSGQFVMKRPDRFRWHIMTPYEQIIIADGKSLWSIDMDLEQVTVADLDKNIVNSPIMLLSRENSQLSELFSVRRLEEESDKTMERFLLLPIDDSSNFEQVQLGFIEGILQLIELHDSLGQITLVTMTNIRNNPIISNKPFEYQIIDDFDVIDSRVKASSGD